MQKFSLLFSVLLLAASSQTFATLTPPNCTPVRQAHAKIAVSRMHWVQKNGAYQLREDVVCTARQDLGVLSGIAANCISPVLLKCQIELAASRGWWEFEL